MLPAHQWAIIRDQFLPEKIGETSLTYIAVYHASLKLHAIRGGDYRRMNQRDASGAGR